jgi:quercetin dioxygenase-like cupin family protein
MEFKHNDATINRPEGSRFIDAPAVFTNLAETIGQLRNEKAWDTNDLNGITVFKSDSIAIVATLMKQGTTIRKNLLDTPFTLLVLSGELKIATEENNYTLKPACMLNLHAQIVHDITAKKETVLLQMTHS